MALTVIIIIIIIPAILGYLGIMKWLRRKKYPPVAGTMFNQLLNFKKLHHYMTHLAAKYKTYRLLTPFRNEIYTSDPSNIEYFLKTNFSNYGKVCQLSPSSQFHLHLLFVLFTCSPSIKEDLGNINSTRKLIRIPTKKN